MYQLSGMIELPLSFSFTERERREKMIGFGDAKKKGAFCSCYHERARLSTDVSSLPTLIYRECSDIRSRRLGSSSDSVIERYRAAARVPKNNRIGCGALGRTLFTADRIATVALFAIRARGTAGKAAIN